MSKILLAVSAHPDDVEFACGGTLFNFRQKGFEIYLIVATNGENGFKIAHRPRNERINIRLKEQTKAADFLGIKKVFFLNFRDGYLKNDEKLRDKIAVIIKKVKPGIVLSFDPAYKAFNNINLNHRDHRAVAEAAFDAVFAARNRYMLPGNQHSVNSFYFYITGKPNHYENIAKNINNKIGLVKCHSSQYDDEKSFEKWIISNLCRYTKKYKYSEQFRIVKIIQPIKEIKN